MEDHLKEIDSYEGLVELVVSEYRARELKDAANAKDNDVYMRWHDDCFERDEIREINLWSYWQGVGVVRPDIMLVGQDWGCLENSDPKVIQNIRTIACDPNTKVQYYSGYGADKRLDFVTDEHLIRLFDSLGYYDIRHNRYYRLFFTNLCYRSKGSSSELRSSWMTRDRAFFKRLVELKKPEVILFLGRQTYENGMKALFDSSELKGLPEIPAATEGGFNRFLDEQFSREPIEWGGSKIFALCHPGNISTNLRNAEKLPPEERLKPQLEDWAHLKDYVDPKRSEVTSSDLRC